MPEREFPQETDPLWYKDAIIYEVHVRSFYDSVDDGMGDFAGLRQKLDYIQDLGVTAIWILPFCPSPWKDDGYDIADYTNVHPIYGTLKDFQAFLDEAHKRGLRVITELVLNHTSDQHGWFQRSRRAAPGSHWRNFYVWSDTPEKYKDARIIFKDFEPSNWTWDPVAKAYYWHRFFSHQPDLNFEYGPVREALVEAMDFWLDMGVDGLRLDAVPYLFEREGTTCENLPETHGFLKELRKHVDGKYQGRMILAEANQWPEDAIAYFGSGDECHMAFHFPVMPRLFMAARMEDRYPITDILRLTPAIPADCQWAMFLRNHDELTLEMVTDEERDYMYRVYAEDRTARINLGIRRRLAPLLGNDRRRIELMNGLLFSLPGTPVIYYGDEIGMGDNFYLGDRNGVRTPMQWSSDRNAGFSKANPQKLYLPAIIDPEYHYEAVNVEAQQNNPNSLLWWMKRTIAQRKRTKAFGRGSLEMLQPENRKVLAFIREYEEERILVVANLSRFTQCCELDLSRFEGAAPTEMFGGTEFPRITKSPYFLTLGSHAFHWFLLATRVTTPESLAPGERRSAVRVSAFEDVFTEAGFPRIEKALAHYILQRHWFLGRNRKIRSLELADSLPVPGSSTAAATMTYFILVRVEFSEGDPEFYLLPLAIAAENTSRLAERPSDRQSDRAPERASGPSDRTAECVVAMLRDATGKTASLYHAVGESDFANALLTAVGKRKPIRGLRGELTTAHTRAFKRIWGTHPQIAPFPLKAPQNHSNIGFGDRFVLKLYRKLEPGPAPEIELLQQLTEHTNFKNAPALAGTLIYRPKRGEPIPFGLLQEFRKNEGDAWRVTLDNLGLFLERALATRNDPRMTQLPTTGGLLELATVPPPAIITELMAGYLEMVRILGERCGQMHIALASNTESPDFSPEPFTDYYRQGLYHGMMGALGRTFDQLRRRVHGLEGAGKEEVVQLLAQEETLRSRFKRLRDQRVYAMRTRIHGDFHLAQVLFTGKDFVVIDFEGTPARPVGERRIKKSPLRDLASMLRSFHYASRAALLGHVPGTIRREPGQDAEIERLTDVWFRWISATFFAGYLSVARAQEFIPQDQGSFRVLLDCYLLERALEEIDFDLYIRPDWLRISVKGLLGLSATLP